MAALTTEVEDLTPMFLTGYCIIRADLHPANRIRHSFRHGFLPPLSLTRRYPLRSTREMGAFLLLSRRRCLHGWYAFCPGHRLSVEVAFDDVHVKEESFLLVWWPFRSPS